MTQISSKPRIFYNCKIDSPRFVKVTLQARTAEDNGKKILEFYPLRTIPLKPYLKNPLLEAKKLSKWYYNDEGKIRLRYVRTKVENMRTLSYEDLLEVYQEWRDSDEFLVLAKPEQRKFLAVKCAKRGNDVYQYRIDQRFKEIDELADGMGYDRIFNINDSKPKTNVLMITLTFDTKICSAAKAWDRIGSDWNRYIAYLERKYKRVSFIRTWEGSKKGYPHIHAIIYFEEHQFDVWEQNVSEYKTKYRVVDKEGVKGNYHSHIDVQALSTLGGSLKYITKYLRKQHLTGKGVNLTQAQMWLHRNQSFSVSKDFVKLVRGLRLDNESLHNSNVPDTQTTLDGEDVEEKWRFVGIYARHKLEPLVEDPKRFKTKWTAHLKSLNGLEIRQKKEERRIVKYDK